MAVNYEPFEEDFVSDMTSINQWARDEAARRRALKWCMNNTWADLEIGCLERIENSRRWGWVMYAHRPGQTQPPGA